MRTLLNLEMDQQRLDKVFFQDRSFENVSKFLADDSTCRARTKLRAMTSKYKMPKLDSFRSLEICEYKRTMQMLRTRVRKH